MYVCMYVCIHNQKLNCDKSDFGSCAVWKMLIWSELRERERERERERICLIRKLVVVYLFVVKLLDWDFHVLVRSWQLCDCDKNSIRIRGGVLVRWV